MCFQKLRVATEVVARYQAALKLKGDSKRGAETFAKVCVTCHKTPDGKGFELGPEIRDIQNSRA